MKLQSKVLIILASIWAIVCLFLYLDARFVLEKNYRALEKQAAIKDIKRAQKALVNKLSELQLYTTSWSQWDDAYDFMSNKNERFIKSSFVPGTFTSANINFFMFYNTAGQLYDGRAFDLVNKKFAPIPNGLLDYLQAHPAFVIHSNNYEGNVGILKIPEGNVIMSSLPVLTSDGKGPAAGTLLMGYYLTPQDIENLSSTIELTTKFFPLPLPENISLLKKAYAHMLNSTENYFIAPINKQTTYGFTLVKDIENKPIGMLQITLPRDLYGEGLVTIKHYLAIFLVLGILILATMWYLIKKLVLDRVVSVGDQVIDINSESNFHNRIEITGTDELNKMVLSINSMLEIIELTQDQLKYRISRRTKELDKLSLLNRNLFSEMSKQKSIETKLREDEKLLRQMAYYDSLTGLPNRAFFTEFLLKAISHADNEKNKIAILFVDVDKFKKINDTYGHDFGDKFLKEIASRLKKSIKDTDVVARLSGDEFIAFISNVDEKESIDEAVTQMFMNLTPPIKIDNIIITPTYSIGISIYPDDGATIEELCNQADLAMYYAKKRDGNIYYYYDAINTKTSKSPLPY